MSWMKMASARQGLDRSKVRMQILRKPFVHFVLCFFVGFGIGLTPLNSGGGSGEQRDPFKAATRIATEKEVHNAGLDSRPRQELPSNSSRFGELRQPVEKLLIIVTPTYTRPFQAMYLTRLAHTLKLVDPPLLWIVVEMPGQSLETASLLRNTGVMYRHLASDKNLTNIKDRGIHQRNLALQHIERHQLDGIVYFADDDTYRARIVDVALVQIRGAVEHVVEALELLLLRLALQIVMPNSTAVSCPSNPTKSPKSSSTKFWDCVPQAAQ